MNSTYIIRLLSLFSLCFFASELLSNETTPHKNDNQTINFSYWDQATPPFVLTENDVIVGGIIKDIGDNIGHFLKRPASYLKLPVSRIEPYLKSGKVDADCVTSPIWKETPKDLLWSPVLFQGSDRFLVKNDTQITIQKFSDLKGKQIGIYNGYVYHPEIMKMIKNKSVTTVKIKDLKKGIELLQLDRIDTLIDFDTLIEYELLAQNLQNKFSLAEKHADDFNLFCAYSKESNVSPAEFNDAVAYLISTGKIKEILSAYR